MRVRTRSLKDLLDALDEGVCLLNASGLITDANAAALSLLKCSAGELIGQPAAEAIGAPELAEGISRLIATPGQPIEGVANVRGLREESQAVEYGLVAVSDKGESSRPGQLETVVLRFRKRAEPATCEILNHDSEIKLEVVLDTIVDAVVVADEFGRIQLVNAATERLFGYVADELLGQNVKTLMPPPDREAHDGYLQHYRDTGEKKIIGIGREVLARRKDGSVFPVYLSIGDAKLNGQRLFVGVLHDLTSRKQNEARLTIMSAAIEQSPTAVMILDRSGLMQYVNSGFTVLTGYKPEEAIGMPLSLICEDWRDTARLLEQLAMVDIGVGKREEIQGRRRSGERYWALQTISPIRDRQGAVTHFLATHLNITDQKKAKQALQESESRFQQVAEMTGEWLWEQDPSGRYIYCSNAVFGILGYRPDEILGKSYLDLMTDEDRALWSGQAAQTTGQRKFHRLINRYRHRDGHEVYTESTGAPLFDAAGRLVKWRGVDSDITARKQYEDALRLRDRAIEAASVGIDIADARNPNHPNIYVNRALTKITGYSREELLGRNMAMLQGPETDPAAVEKVVEALREGRSCEVILKNYRKDGTYFWNDLVISPVHDDAGLLTHYIGILSDVTELRRAAEERHELEIAKQIQLSLLPKDPLSRPGVKVVGICLPAAHVGGDYYDYFMVGDTLDVVIADVSGHSVGAALIMAEARSALKAETRETNCAIGSHGAAGILRTLNEVLHDDLSGSDLFISMFYLRYQPRDRRLHYANAGHNCPLILPAQADRCRQLDAEGMILGVKRSVEFTEESEVLNPGDRVLLYTDGSTEAQSKEGEFFGVGRLCALLTRTRKLPPEDAIATILQELQEFCGEASFRDDVSFVIVDVAE
jgi:sigma-B regulation protein RsbU (phosphoserine phosphatase)